MSTTLQTICHVVLTLAALKYLMPNIREICQAIADSGEVKEKKKEAKELAKRKKNAEKPKGEQEQAEKAPETEMPAGEETPDPAPSTEQESDASEPGETGDKKENEKEAETLEDFPEWEA